MTDRDDEPAVKGIPSKSALRDELLALLRAHLDTLERSHRAALEGATHEEAKPEDDKDTRALEQAYLARGQALRHEELVAAVHAVEHMPIHTFGEDALISMGALVVASERSSTLLFFVAPHGGGSRLAGGRVQVVTPKSPLGVALLQHRAGEECEVSLAGRTRELAIEQVA